MQLHDIVFDQSSPPTHAGRVDNIIVAHLVTLLTEGQHAGAWTLEDPRFTAIFLFGGLHATIDQANNRHKRINRARLFAQ